MTTLEPLGALYARVTAPAAPAVPLARRERRRTAEAFPTVPIRGLELTAGEVAAALFETGADELTLPVPDTDTLYDALNGAVRVLGPAGIAEALSDFPELDAEEFPEVGACRRFAYRLALPLLARLAHANRDVLTSVTTCVTSTVTPGVTARSGADGPGDPTGARSTPSLHESTPYGPDHGSAVRPGYLCSPRPVQACAGPTGEAVPA
ncbi:hypothetical protein [Streptomyces sp. SM1]|uniref:hypothetical protein n=1 Tax=Streptomyces sp. SM1 TaxID=402229 RepID=UPI0021565B38|nr:hypothetical protein [Streptomyces sp. SM1]